jgi:hypothetical protein
MTQAVNLANFANNLNSSGQVDPGALSSAVAITKGGTGATTASAARTNLGLGTVATLNSVTDAYLSNTGVTAGSYGSNLLIPVVTVTATGRISSVTTASAQGGQFIGTTAVKAIAYNAQTISEDLTIAGDQNGLSAGPITINTGYTVTVDTGGNWSIV